MNIIVLGMSAHETWFAERLTSQGFAITQANPQTREQFTRLGVSAGLLFEDILLDSGQSGLAVRQQLSERLHPLHYAELAGSWISAGRQYGFPLYAGSPASLRPRLKPVLDALAPQANAWLYCGPPGSGRYAAQVMDALSMAWVLACQAGWAQPGDPPTPPDWNAFFKQQQQLTNKLLQYARNYLSHFPLETVSTAELAWSALDVGISRQEHFSANLARLLILVLNQPSPPDSQPSG